MPGCKSAPEVAEVQQGSSTIQYRPSNTDRHISLSSNPTVQKTTSKAEPKVVTISSSTSTHSASVNHISNVDNLSTEILREMIDNSRGETAFYNGNPVKLLTPIENFVLKRNCNFTQVLKKLEENNNTSDNNDVTQMPLISKTCSSTDAPMFQRPIFDDLSQFEIAEIKYKSQPVDTVVRKAQNTVPMIRGIGGRGGCKATVLSVVVLSSPKVPTSEP